MPLPFCATLVGRRDRRKCTRATTRRPSEASAPKVRDGRPPVNVRFPPKTDISLASAFDPLEGRRKPRMDGKGHEAQGQLKVFAPIG